MPALPIFHSLFCFRCPVRKLEHSTSNVQRRIEGAVKWRTMRWTIPGLAGAFILLGVGAVLAQAEPQPAAQPMQPLAGSNLALGKRALFSSKIAFNTNARELRQDHSGLVSHAFHHNLNHKPRLVATGRVKANLGRLAVQH